MAEATALRNNALPYPVYSLAYTVVFPLLDADGDLVTGGGADTPDSEVSKNGDTFADCTNEMTEVATNSGMYFLTLTAAEMTAEIVTIICKTATAGTKTTPIVLYPRKLVQLRSGTSGGATGSLSMFKLDAAAGDENNTWIGCLIVATIDGTAEARIINAYNGDSQDATVAPDFVTATPDEDDTFVIYLPDGVLYSWVDVRRIDDGESAAQNLKTAGDSYSATRGFTGTAVPAVAAAGSGGLFTRGTGAGQINQSTNGQIDVDVQKWLGTAPLGLSSQRVQVDVQAIDGLASAATVLGLWLAEGVQTVADSGTTTTLVDAVLTQADGYWNGALLVFRSGTNAGRTAIITDFDAATDTLTFAPAVPDAVTTEGYVLIPGLGWSDVQAINTSTQRATELAQIAQYLFANAVNLTNDSVVKDDSVVAQILVIGGNISDYDDTLHSQEAIRDAIDASARAANAATAGNITTGTDTANGYEETATPDGTAWQVAGEAADGNGNGIDMGLTFALGTAKRADTVSVRAKEDQVGVVHVWAWNYMLADWERISDTGTAISGATYKDYEPYILLDRNQQVSDGEVKLRFTATGVATNKYLWLDKVNVLTGGTASLTAGDIAQAVGDHDVSVHTDHDSLGFHVAMSVINTHDVTTADTATSFTCSSLPAVTNYYQFNQIRVHDTANDRYADSWILSMDDAGVVILGRALPFTPDTASELYIMNGLVPPSENVDEWETQSQADASGFRVTADDGENLKRRKDGIR